MKIGQWIEKNLWTIIVAALGIYSGYISGQTRTGTRLDAIEADVKSIKEALKIDPAQDMRLCRLEALNNMGECKR